MFERFDLATNHDSSFGMAMAPKPPKVLRPLVYCGYRVKDAQTGAVDVCDVLACGVIEEMPLCTHHGPLIQRGLESEEV